MAADTATTTTTLRTQSASSTKPNRRYRRDTAASGDSPGSNHMPDSPQPSQSRRSGSYCGSPIVNLPSNSSSPSGSFRIQVPSGSLSPVMDFTNSTTRSNGYSGSESFPSSFSKFNSALTAGLLNPMSPPPQIDKTRSSPTLIDLIANEPDIQIRNQIPLNPVPFSSSRPQISVQEKQAVTLQRISDILASRSPGNLFNDQPSSDIKLTLSSKDGISIFLNLHRQVLVAHSRFFAAKLSDRWTKQQRSSLPYIVEIADCDDVEVYVETLGLMYCKDLRKRLMKVDVPSVLGILKVSVAIGFDAGILTCLEFLEAAPWAEDEEEKVASLLSELRLEGVGAEEVLKRVSLEVAYTNQEGNGNEEVLVKLLHVVLEGKDERARREMKVLVSKMLHENPSQNDLKKESLYSACDKCLNSLHHHFLKATTSDLQEVGQIARQADNLHWILDILIDRQIAEDFLTTWASQYQLADSHPKVPALHRHEVSRVTARLFVGIGKGQLLVSKEARCLLLKTWLVPFYDDFGWMKRASNGLDRHLIEDGLSNTILTLPLALQQDILLAWFGRFLNSGEDCPNIHKGFEVWWRRAFWKQNGKQERVPCQFRVTSA